MKKIGRPQIPLWIKLMTRFIPNRDTRCWEYTKRLANGYGQINHNGKTMLAHRVSWETIIGPIPNGIFVCHKCDNPPCINPDHLFLGNRSENMIDMHRKGRGTKPGRSRFRFCKKGHEYTVDNTFIRKDNLRRECRECRKIQSKKQDALRKNIRALKRKNKNGKRTSNAR